MGTRARQPAPQCAPALAPGFTLVEMLIVVLILAVAAGLAAPMLRGTDATRLSEAARLLTADLAYAQVESIAHADDLRLVGFDTANHRYWIAKASMPAEPLLNPADGGKDYEVIFGQGRAAALGGVTISGLAVGSDQRLTFGMYGQLTETGNSPVTVTLACGEGTLTITVDRVSGDTTVGKIQ